MRFPTTKYLALFLAIFYFNNIYSQILERPQSIGAYIYNFTKHIKWPDENQLKEFHIVFISDDSGIIKEFEKISKTAKIKGKPIKITSLSVPGNICVEAQIVFISEDKTGYYMDVFDKIDGKQVLLISENYKDKRFAMINLYDSGDRKMLFEINKSNIINQGLSIDDEILLMGGTVIDVAQLYRNSQQSLRSIEKSLKSYQQKLDSANAMFAKIQAEIKQQKNLIENQNKLINEQKNEIQVQLSKTDEQKLLVEKQKQILQVQQDSLKKQLNKLYFTEQDLKKQKTELSQGKLFLLKQQAEIKKMDSVIQNKTNILSQQNVTINRQRQFLYSFIIIIFLVIVLAFVIFKAYRNNKKHNDLLKAQKLHIEQINHEVQSSNEELHAANEELNNKNEELSITLDKLKETQDQLLQSEKMASLGVLTAGIAHEMNNPINFVYAGVNSLKKDFSDLMPILEEIRSIEPDRKNIHEIFKRISELKESNSYNDALDAIIQTIDDIQLGADRTSEIVKGLRNFSRIDKEQWQLANIHDCLNDALILLKNKYKHHVEIIKNFASDLPQVECFSGKLNQAFVNIISNAVDAIDKKGQIIISTSSMGQMVTIKIKDNGSGISNEIRSKIFDPFFTTKTVGKGQGLGLSITYGIIEEHNGKIELKTDSGTGTEFIIHLPITHNK